MNHQVVNLKSLPQKKLSWTFTLNSCSKNLAYSLKITLNHENSQKHKTLFTDLDNLSHLEKEKQIKREPGKSENVHI